MAEQHAIARLREALGDAVAVGAAVRDALEHALDRGARDLCVGARDGAGDPAHG